MTSNKLATPRSYSKPTTTALKATLVAFGVLFLTIAILLWPFAVIWSLNYLFGLHLAYSFGSWLAATILLMVFSGASRVSNRSKD